MRDRRALRPWTYGLTEPAAAGIGTPGAERDTAGDPAPASSAADAVAWAMAHLSEREAVFSRSDLLAAALAHAPGAVAIGEVEHAVAALERGGALHAVDLPGAEASLATDRTVGEERETVALMRGGQARGRPAMRSWQVQGHLNKGPLTAGQKDAVKLILSAKDRTVGVQGYAGTGKTTMLNRASARWQRRRAGAWPASRPRPRRRRRWPRRPAFPRKPSRCSSPAMPAWRRAG